MIKCIEASEVTLATQLAHRCNYYGIDLILFTFQQPEYLSRAQKLPCRHYTKDNHLELKSRNIPMKTDENAT